MKNKEEKLIKKGMSLEILHYNCRSLATQDRMHEFETALGEIRWDIIGLSEIRRKGEKLTQGETGDYFYYFGETVGQTKVGF